MRRIFLAMALGMVQIMAGSAGLAQRGARATDPVIVLPQRTSSDAPAVVLPELPPGAASITPATMVVVIERRPASGPATRLLQTVTRTATRVHIQASDSREFFFEQNPVDPRRVSGSVIHHDKRTIVRYEDSELRNWLAIRGWADVVTLGLEVDVLGALQPTRQRKALATWTFVRFVAREKKHPLREVWWDADQALPSSFRIVDGTGSTTVTVNRIERATKDDLLRSPAARFPNYRVVDLADWLER